MLYANTASGFKSGGFDARILVDSMEKFEFKDEAAFSIELGNKMSLLDGSGELNIAFFYRRSFRSISRCYTPER